MKNDKKIITVTDVGIVCLGISSIGCIIMIIVGLIYKENILTPIMLLFATTPSLLANIKKNKQ
ncbi:hypothetical protein IGI96_003753 [Enterococcus sp. DIV0421]|uniref:hypothetical protein n=1 Tax=Enterococcus sp. DIV0421 TaxID=2774688 RepID=UPI003F25CD29